MRKIASVVLVVGLMASLAACSSGATKAASSCTPVKSGKSSDAVAVSGKYGKEPTVKIKSPVTTPKSTQRTVVTTGKGKVVKQGAQVDVDFAMYNGTTGKELTTTGFNGQPTPFPIDATQLLPGIVKTLKCSTIGSRVVGVIPPADAFSKTGSTDLGVGAKDSIVMVADLVSIAPTPLKSAKGTAKAPVAGMPTVKFSSKGLPTVTIPDTPQPADFQEEVLIKGNGPKVGTNANVVVNYQLVLWRTKAVVSGNDTWAAGQTAPLNTGGVIPGFKQAIEGQTVGSRVLVVIPPALGYGSAGSSSAGITGTDDLVFLVDILGLG